MTGTAIFSAIFMAVVIIGGLLYCFSKMGKGGGEWED
jgi:hypothetical protein